MAGRNLTDDIDHAQAELAAAEQPPDTAGGAIDVASRPRSIREQLDRAQPAIRAALPDGFPGGPERFARIVLTAVRMTPQLTRCTPASVIGAAMQSAQLGLTPGVLGEAWIIPFRNGKTGEYEAQFMVGWKGMVALAHRAGYRMTGATVHERDAFDYELGLEPTLRHKPALGDRGVSVYWYAIARSESTGQLAGFAVLDRAMVDKRRKASKSPDSPAWRSYYDEMALGKAAREACRFLPLTVEMANALASDGVVRTDLAGQADEYPGDDYVDVDSDEAET